MEKETRLVSCLNKLVSALERFNPFIQGLGWVGGAICFLWVCYVFLDVLLRYVFNKPFSGSETISAVTLLTVVSFGLAYAQSEKTHISVDAVTSKLPLKARIAVDTTVSLTILVVMGVLTYEGVLNSIAFFHIKQTQGVFELPLGPFAALLSLGFAAWLIVLFKEFFKKMVAALRLNLGGHIWFMMFGIPILLMALMLWWMQSVSPQINPVIVGVLAVVLATVIIFLEMPVGLASLTIGFVFLGHLTNTATGFRTTGMGLYWTLASADWGVLAFFILMGYLLVITDIGKDIYLVAYKWVGHFRGGLAQATTVAQTAFGAVCGDATASLATFSAIALPEMKKYKYADTLACGSISAGAIIAVVIPPSLPLIIYGILAQWSIGKLFVGAIIPGLMLMISFMVITYFSCRINPNAGPAGEKASWGSRIRSLKLTAPVLILFMIVIGGIWAGVFTAMEGGAIGAFMAFIIALAFKRLTWKGLNIAIMNTVKFTASILFMVCASIILNYAISASNLTKEAIQLVVGLNIPPLAVMGVVIVIFLLVGCFASAPALLMISTPILAPIFVSMGLDLTWAGVILVIMSILGTITPPFAGLLFVLHGIAKDVSMFTIFRGVIPYCISTMVVVLLILFFPFLVTFLPALMFH